MTKREFMEKLYPVFTKEQIARLEEYALESAKDAQRGFGDLTEEDLHYIGRWHVCEWLTYADLNEIRMAAGSDVTWEQLDKLSKQMKEEW